MEYLSKFQDILDNFNKDNNITQKNTNNTTSEKTYAQSAKELFLRYQTSPEGLEALQKYKQLDKDLTEKEVINACLKTGDIIPNFSAYNYKGLLHNIFELFNTKFLILVFYRGQFCPFCNLQLRYLEKELVSIENCPATLVAISPQTISNSFNTRQNNQLTYEILSDKGNKVSRMFGLSYIVPDYLKDFHVKMGVSDEYFDVSKNMHLVMPATYIVNREGEILYDFIETNAGIRLEPKKISEIIKGL